MSDIIGNVGLFLLIAFLLAKAVWDGYDFSMSKKTKKKTPSKKSKSWWKKNISSLWKKASPLNKAYFFITLIIFIPLILLFFVFYWQIGAFLLGKVTIGIRELAFAFFGTISGIAGLFGVYLAILRSEEYKRQNDIADRSQKTASEQNKITTEQNKIINKQNEIANKQSEIANRQANTAEQAQITERLNKAVEGLGKNDATGAVVEVRLGALYALERIAKDSIRDHIQIMEILCAYVRANSPSSKKDKKEEPKPLREDIHAALAIIGRRDKWPEGEQRLATEKDQSYIIDLSYCNLYRAELTGANLHGANLDSADLHSAILISVNLSETWLTDASLDNAWIANGDMTGAWLDNASMKKTVLMNTKTDKAYAQIIDLSKCETITKEQINKMFCGFGTKIPSDLEPCPEHWPTKKLPFEAFQDAREKWISKKP